MKIIAVRSDEITGYHKGPGLKFFPQLGHLLEGR